MLSDMNYSFVLGHSIELLERGTSSSIFDAHFLPGGIDLLMLLRNIRGRVCRIAYSPIEACTHAVTCGVESHRQRPFYL